MYGGRGPHAAEGVSRGGRPGRGARASSTRVIDRLLLAALPAARSSTASTSSQLLRLSARATPRRRWRAWTSWPRRAGDALCASPGCRRRCRIPGRFYARFTRAAGARSRGGRLLRRPRRPEPRQRAARRRRQHLADRLLLDAHRPRARGHRQARERPEVHHAPAPGRRGARPGLGTGSGTWAGRRTCSCPPPTLRPSSSTIRRSPRPTPPSRACASSAAELLREAGLAGPVSAREYRIAQLRYSAHTLTFEECDARQKRFALGQHLPARESARADPRGAANLSRPCGV